MKKTIEKPVVNVVKLEAVDICCASSVEANTASIIVNDSRSIF